MTNKEKRRLRAIWNRMKRLGVQRKQREEIIRASLVTDFGIKDEMLQNAAIKEIAQKEKNNE